MSYKQDQLFSNVNFIYSNDKNFVFFTMEEVLEKIIPTKIAEIQKTICLTNDEIIAVMRYFKWNVERAQEQWYDNEEKISH